ncbi:DUF2155 domain-containing protein [Tabrizicola sp.]|uniref:DUF2155 domain-containing protein n=1 Tax=Tabrizicola sp. TaxID=2005166 RepID=UPI002627D0E4|nr:DUF2155 domain-containing protein [Tabrizicola sp.]MDM7930906.1 DUF2155 domain-containing protein [Tabrizicola sp.]
MKQVCLALFVALASPALAQEFVESDGATLRFLDRLTSETGDVILSRGQAARFGGLVVRLDSCRYPADNPTSDASAHLTVISAAGETELFNGWMLASSPALSALDHPRYDVWVLDCVLPEAADDATSDAEGE